MAKTLISHTRLNLQREYVQFSFAERFMKDWGPFGTINRIIKTTNSHKYLLKMITSHNRIPFGTMILINLLNDVL